MIGEAEGIQSGFEFAGVGSRSVVARFDGRRITSYGGGLLLRETDRRTGLLNRLAVCFRDGRDAGRVQHSLREMLAQRIYGLALGYEDLNDHEQLRTDPMMSVLADKADAERPLAGKSTPNRLELGGAAGDVDPYKKVHYDAGAIDELLVSLFLEAHKEAPPEIVIDLEATDLPVHGHQEQRFFHSFYNHYCHLPLYILSGDHLLGVRLRARMRMRARARGKKWSAS